MDVDGMLI